MADNTGFLTDGELAAVEALAGWALTYFGVGGIVIPAVNMALEIGNKALSMGQSVPSMEALRSKAAGVAALPGLEA